MWPFRTAPIRTLTSRRAWNGVGLTTPGSSTTTTAAVRRAASAAFPIQAIMEPRGTPARPFAPAMGPTLVTRLSCTTRAWAYGLPATWRPAAVARVLASGVHRMASPGPLARARTTAPMMIARVCGWITTQPVPSTGECTSLTTTSVWGAAHCTSRTLITAPLGRRCNSMLPSSAIFRSPVTCKAVAVFT
jgi:hypothetical protein